MDQSRGTIKGHHRGTAADFTHDLGQSLLALSFAQSRVHVPTMMHSADPSPSASLSPRSPPAIAGLTARRREQLPRSAPNRNELGLFCCRTRGRRPRGAPMRRARGCVTAEVNKWAHATSGSTSLAPRVFWAALARSSLILEAGRGRTEGRTERMGAGALPPFPSSINKRGEGQTGPVERCAVCDWAEAFTDSVCYACQEHDMPCFFCPLALLTS